MEIAFVVNMFSDMVVLGHWLLDGRDKLVRFDSSPPFIEGRCPGSRAVIFNETNSFAATPIINLNGRSFTIACWIKQTKWALDESAAIYGDWYSPWQFLLSKKNRRIVFNRHKEGSGEWWYVESTVVALDTWTHVAVTWDQLTRTVFIYADGKKVGNGSYTHGATFFQPTGSPYQIGNDGHDENHQFHGSVMDLYVFGTALSVNGINKLRGFPVIMNKTEVVTGRFVVVKWEPPLDGACPIVGYTLYYREVMSLGRKTNWHSIAVDRNDTTYTLQLSCWKEYDVAVTSRSAYKESNFSDSNIWNFKTGGDLTSLLVITNKETESLTCDVNLTWKAPKDNGCPLTMYSIYYRQIQPQEREAPWLNVNVTDILTTNLTISLACGKQYIMEISAWNELGESGRSRPWIIKTISENNTCHEEDWQITFTRKGWENCSMGRYLNGLWRESDAVFSSPDGIDNIKRGRCCTSPQEYKNNTRVCQIVDWKSSLSRNYQWASCPEGYFLQGVYRSSGTSLSDIEQALCCRPRNFKIANLDCYIEGVRVSFDRRGWSKCWRDMYYMVGMYKGGCDNLYCIEMLRCCRMKPPGTNHGGNPSDMVVLGHWLLDGRDELVRFDSSLPFIEGRCRGSRAVIFNETNSFAATPIINLNGRSFTIACWIKQTKWALNESAAIYSDWYSPWQFLLNTKNQRIGFNRHKEGSGEWWYVESTHVALDTWTHVAVTWDQLTRTVFIYADGKKVGHGSYTHGATFFQPTGSPYQIGNDGHDENHQFHGSVMDLYVFGMALSVNGINKLRGVPVIVNKTEAVTGRFVVVTWEPPLHGACPIVGYTLYYREVMSLGRKTNWDSIAVDRNDTTYTLQLSCGKEYDVAVTSRSAYKESNFSDSNIWNFKTGGDFPSLPVITNRETESLTCDVNLMWSAPEDNGCPLTMYSIYYRQIQPQEREAPWLNVNVTDILATNLTISLACGKQYIMEISAWNELGESARSRSWITKTLSDSDIRNSKGIYSGELVSVPQLAGLLVGLGVLIIIIFVVIFSLRRIARRKRRHALNLRPRRSKSTIIPLRRWEVLPQQVIFEDEIGRGAFGKVFKGTFKESPGIEVFYEPRRDTVDFRAGRTVAIKVLGDKTDEEARSQFLEEIELMKAIGSHRNVLGMLGCWVNTDPIFLVLEYVPYGDLLQWLRNKRIQKSYQKNYDNDGNHLTLTPNQVDFCTDDESKALLTRDDEEREKLVNSDKQNVDLIKKDSACRSTLNGETVPREDLVEEVTVNLERTNWNRYEEPTRVIKGSFHGNVQRKDDFTAKDLLCFAWQIARGMSFLASNGFVHRDLAARNVLLGEDKVVKISDFGLMRQTNQSVYKLKKGKKIPVKWLAPEALYNSEYTTKSDVWSFGILLWELSTMGGNPYPGINNKELYNLLKTGYRMEKPDTCCDELYQLMLNCWKDEPSERPTFEIVTRSLEEMIQKDTPYLDFESLDESKPYYCNEKLSDEDVMV